MSFTLLALGVDGAVCVYSSTVLQSLCIERWYLVVLYMVLCLGDDPPVSRILRVRYFGWTIYKKTNTMVYNSISLYISSSPHYCGANITNYVSQRKNTQTTATACCCCCCCCCWVDVLRVLRQAKVLLHLLRQNDAIWQLRDRYITNNSNNTLEQPFSYEQSCSSVNTTLLCALLSVRWLLWNTLIACLAFSVLWVCWVQARRRVGLEVSWYDSRIPATQRIYGLTVMMACLSAVPLFCCAALRAWRQRLHGNHRLMKIYVLYRWPSIFSLALHLTFLLCMGSILKKAQRRFIVTPIFHTSAFFSLHLCPGQAAVLGDGLSIK